MIKPSPAAAYSYSYATEGGMVRITANTAAGIAGVWYVTAAEALSFAIRQAGAK